jgi:hypothetical protein
MMDEIQRIHTMYGGCDPRAESGGSKLAQARQCMDLEHCLHWLHFDEPTRQ